jgi:cytoskeletal protein CcmA (bactofilin family)
VIVFGSVDGKITARERIDLRKNSHVVGDLVSAVIAMEDGAYMKGTIEVLREETNDDLGLTRQLSISNSV